MKLKFKSKKIIKVLIMTFFLNSSLILSQDIKYNVIKEISTMEEINNEMFTDSEAISSKDVKTVTAPSNNEDKNKTVINDRIESPLMEGEEEEEKTSAKIPTDNSNTIPEKESETKNDSEKVAKETENPEIDDSITYTLPKIEKTFSDNPKNDIAKKREDGINAKVNRNRHEQREREKKENKFEEINDRTNRVTALGSAMGAVDLGSTPEKKVRLGAGVGNSSSTQAVAVGIGYAPTNRFRINTKFSSSTNNMNNNSISVGASYDLDL